MPKHPDVDEFDEDEFDDDDADEWDENSESLYLKYQFEGSTTIDELATRLRGLAGYLDCLGADGWRLDQPVDGGHAQLTREPLC